MSRWIEEKRQSFIAFECDFPHEHDDAIAMQNTEKKRINIATDAIHHTQKKYDAIKHLNDFMSWIAIHLREATMRFNGGASKRMRSTGRGNPLILLAQH